MNTTLVWAALLYALVLCLQRPCYEARRRTSDRGRLNAGVLRSTLTRCPSDDRGCGTQRSAAELAPDRVAFAGEDSYACSCLLLIPSPPLFVGASPVPVPVDEDGGLLVPVPGPGGNGLDVPAAGTWFEEQCACRPIKSLPVWPQHWWAKSSGRHAVLRMGEVVQGISAEEVLARARDSPLFFAVRGPQFERWVTDDPHAGASLLSRWAEGDTRNTSVFYNEAYAVLAEPDRAGVVARNVWVAKHTHGRLVKHSTFDMAMNEFEVATWPTGSCACVPDVPQLEWLAHTVVSELRRRVPVASEMTDE